MQHARRTNPYPWTWEIPAAIIAVVLLVMGIALHLARAIANLFAGVGWQLTPRPALFSSLLGLIGGDAGAGLPDAPTGYASSGALWFWIAATELVVAHHGAVVAQSLERFQIEAGVARTAMQEDHRRPGASA